MRWPQREACLDDVRRNKQGFSVEHDESCNAQPVCRVASTNAFPGCQDGYKFTTWMELAIRIVLVGLTAATRVMVPTIQYIQAADWHQYNYPATARESISLGRLIWYLVLGYVVFAALAAILTAWAPSQAIVRVNTPASREYSPATDEIRDGNSRVDHTIVPLSATAQGPGRSSTTATLPYGREGTYESPNDSLNLRPLAGCEASYNVHQTLQLHREYRKSPRSMWGHWDMQLRLVQAVSLSFLAVTVITCALKNLAGRPRPDFLAVCQPMNFDPLRPDFESLGGVPQCGAPMSFRLVDSRRSFPSGHASAAASVFGVGALLLFFELLQPHHVGAATRIVVALGAASPAVYIGLTRIADYRHHWSDVVSGLVLGAMCAWISHNAYFPPNLYCASCNCAAGYEDVGGFAVLPKSSRRLALYESVGLCPHGCRSATPPTQIPEGNLV